MAGIPNLIAIDFDGTCVTHAYPEMGRDIGAEPVLRELVAAGARLILWTMRDGEALKAAVKWFADRKIPLFGINENPEQTIWTQSPKAYAPLYIDDAALGAPLIYPEPVRFGPPESRTPPRPHIDWIAVRNALFGTQP